MKLVLLTQSVKVLTHISKIFAMVESVEFTRVLSLND